MSKYDAAREDAANFGRDDEPEGDYVGIGRNGPTPRPVKPDEYAKQLQRQSQGKPCKHCGAPWGHYIICKLLNKGVKQ